MSFDGAVWVVAGPACWVGVTVECSRGGVVVCLVVVAGFVVAATFVVGVGFATGAVAVWLAIGCAGSEGVGVDAVADAGGGRLVVSATAGGETCAVVDCGPAEAWLE